jgi:hypothetical protein
LHEDVASGHGRADLGARGGFRFGSCGFSCLAHVFFQLWPVARIKQKPTAVASRGFLLNLFRSTSANGVGDYNDDDCHINSL